MRLNLLIFSFLLRSYLTIKENKYGSKTDKPIIDYRPKLPRYFRTPSFTKFLEFAIDKSEKKDQLMKNPIF